MKGWHSEALRTAKHSADALTRIANQLERLNDNLEIMSDDTDPEPVEVPPEVKSQLDALREAGTHNMFTEVKAGLEAHGFDEALAWVGDHPQEYTEGFMDRGFTTSEETDE